ncbi:hypothetical protein QBC33DRAFT_605143 [Phialemonium atrogriseum]|uniref:Short chain oxidoreductase/dehydrogenase n=1 Tax=Phialemonium atrogriseum TaxID=1093897 RepID=A0AAJ0BP70_9PEZI|nr:uncharacterized protein QBC33DRAFT_605143 [Phialemonium atrogriseum]KAK1761635.1 hypothetical protein QBC33DRAFT_605143 [Phialemonium atrogriseum]
MSDNKVWLVTGCSAGLGSALAKTILAHGHKLIASSRNPSKTPDLVDYVTSRSGHWITLDTTAPDLEDIIAQAEAIYGRLDVVVNNAGYPICGAFENLKLEDARQQMETNLWGPCRIMLAVLPGMRTRRSGTIVNISSTAGLRVLPTYSHYSATKFALEAISEGLAHEVAAFNVRVQLVEPGAFRTNFLGADNIRYAPLSEEYRGTVCDDMLAKLRGMDGRQAGDPAAAAERIYEVVTGTGMATGRKPDLRLPLGSDCLQTVRAKLEHVRENFAQSEDIAISTDAKQ